MTRPSGHACSICGNIDSNREWEVREMMFGLRDVFRYTECGQCGVLERTDAVRDWDRYYPEQYYAFQDRPLPALGPLRRRLKVARTQYCLTGRNPLGRILTFHYGVADSLDWMKRLRARLNSPILDIGSGAGHLLYELRDHGFTDLTGIDPFITVEVNEPGLKIFRRSAADMMGTFDVVMLHHSFEHMDEPATVMRDVRRLLSTAGSALIRVPVAGSFAWKQYNTNWVQIDAPRHAFIHTEQSIEVLAREAGLALREVVYDSSELQFWGSEQYRRDIPLTDVQSVWSNPQQDLFSPQEMLEFRSRAAVLNRQRLGDQACFYLTPVLRAG